MRKHNFLYELFTTNGIWIVGDVNKFFASVANFPHKKVKSKIRVEEANFSEFYLRCKKMKHRR